jgi:general secretion pathway protein E
MTEKETAQGRPVSSLYEKQTQERHRKLGELLESAGKLDHAELERALRLQQTDGSRLGPLLVKMGTVSEQDVAEAMASQLSLPLAVPSDYPETPVLEEQLSARFLKQYRIVPLDASGNKIVIAIADPLDAFVIHAIELVSGKRASCRVGVPSEIEEAIERLYGTGKTQMAQIIEDIEPYREKADQQEIARLKDMASEAPVIRLVNLIMQRAVEARASDIHIEPFEDLLKVRYRVDGMLREVEAPPAHLYDAMNSRIKIMAKMDIAERRLPQDGRFMVDIEGSEIDVRVSTIPTMHGESVVMRLLYKGNTVQDYHVLGFSDETLTAFRDSLRRPYGIILVTGPTGSGKTTTLYAALSELNDPERKILTVEDPVEYQLLGINQIQVKPQIGLTFAQTLRSIVRQDPDIIMIGEMRDLETAEIAVQSALTGHLVLSTLHTNDAVSSVTRLLDMGIEGYLVTSVVNGVLAQRLVRTLCTHCRQAYEPLPEFLKKTKLDQLASGPVTLYKPEGCEHCSGTGYRGRVAIMEMLVMTDKIRNLVLRHADAHDIEEAAVSGGMTTMYEDGLQKVLAGVTSLEEVLRVTQEK